MKSIGLLLSLIVSTGAGGSAFALSTGQPYVLNSAYNEEVLRPSNSHPKVNGIVRRVDMAMQKITLKHDEIPNLGMGEMTMTFAVPEMSMIHGLSRGDQVQFQADEVDGVLTVIWIEKL